MVSSSLVLAVVTAVDFAPAFADLEAVSLLQTSSNKVVHAHEKRTSFPDSTWPNGYILPDGKLDDGSKVFLNNQEFALCAKGWTPGMAYSARLNGETATDKYFDTKDSASACLEAAQNEPACQAEEYTAVNYDLLEGHCWCKGPATHNEYMSWTSEGQQRVTCMLDKIPYDGLKKWEMFGGDKKAKIMSNAFQGNCLKNQWVLGTTVAKEGGFKGYVELGREGGHQEAKFYKTPTECIAAAADDDRCGEAAGINFHFISETKDGFQLDGAAKKDYYIEGEDGGLCYCTGVSGAPMFTRKNWVNVISCMTAAPSYGDEEPGPKPDKATCDASKAKFKAARTAKKAFRANIKALREQLKAAKAKWQEQHTIMQEERSTVKACRR